MDYQFELRVTDPEGVQVRHPLVCGEGQVVREAMALQRAFRDLSVDVWREGRRLCGLGPEFRPGPGALGDAGLT